MSRRDIEESAFLAATNREQHLLSHSGLPGPRGNLELMDIASAVSDRDDVVRWSRLGPDEAPENTPGVFLACVGIVGLGRIVAGGDRSFIPALRLAANDPRWRVREAVAMALQAWGDVDVGGLVDELETWDDGTPLEGRAIMAGLCEPRLLRDRPTVARLLDILDRLTESVRTAADPRSNGVRVLRQALGYGWSVAVAADPEIGLPAFERLRADPNPDVRWIVRENLGKARLARIMPG
jgi:hypothetical protein